MSRTYNTVIWGEMYHNLHQRWIWKRAKHAKKTKWLERKSTVKAMDGMNRMIIE